MRKLLNEKNIENIIKYYQFIKDGTEFLQNEVIEVDVFENIDFCFEYNYESWEYNKKHIFNLFRQKLKIKKTLQEKDLYTPSLINDMRREFMRTSGKEFNFLIQVVIDSLEPEEIFKNKLNKDIEFLDVTLRKGWKVTKCFSVLEPDAAELQRQQDLYSVFLQSLSVQGNLVLSIDPLDYITMAVSRSGWSSCHHPNSCHGTGGLAYMNDTATIIAYVETAEPMINYVLDRETGKEHKIEMPNKIWRQVITINNNHDYTLQLKEYPYNSSTFSKETSKMMRELLEDYEGEKYNSSEEWLSDETGELQSNNGDLYGYIFYCDYRNGNSDKLVITSKDSIGNMVDVERQIRAGNLQRIIVGETAYCACGCGDSNYTNQFYIEEATEDDCYYDEY